MKLNHCSNLISNGGVVSNTSEIVDIKKSSRTTPLP